MQDFARRLQQVFGSALILAFFSEFFFFNEGPVSDLLAGLAESPAAAVFGLIELGAFYGLFAYPMLIAIGMFGISGWAALLLVGGIYGLAAESLVVPLVYEAFPYSIIWTSLSWHTLIDVYFGWFILRRIMRAESVWGFIAMLAFTAVFWALWSTWFWVEDVSVALSLGEFAAFSGVATLVLLLGMLMSDHAPLSSFRASRPEMILVSIISAIFFGLTGWAYFPLPIAILAVLGLFLAALFIGRRIGRRKEITETGYLTFLDTAPGWSRYLMLAVLPIVATGTYSIVLTTGFQVNHEIVVLPLLAAGTLSILVAMPVYIWRHR